MIDFDAFALPRGLTAIVGGGGKTTLMTRLSQYYSRFGRVIISTSTHIMKPEFCELLVSPAVTDIKNAFERAPLVAVGSYSNEGKLGPCSISWNELAGLCDYVIVEADGSKRLPLKAPAAHEPVLPENTALTIAVAGIDGAARRIKDAVHRPELYAGLLGKATEDTVSPEDIAMVLTSPFGQRKNVQTRFAVVINKADTPQRLSLARETAAYINDEVFITALEAEEAIIYHREQKK